MDFTKFSANPFDCGSSGVTGVNLKPICFAYALRSSPKYGGPLSDVRVLGMPWVERMRFRTGLSFLKLVEVTISTSGYLRVLINHHMHIVLASDRAFKVRM